MKTKKIFLMFFLLLCATGAFYYGSLHAKGEKELVVGFALHPMIRNYTISSGKGAAEAQEIFQKVAEEFKRLYGYEITLKIYPAPKFLFKAIQEGTADITLGGLADFLYMKNHGIPVRSFLTTGAAKGEKFCIWVHKNSGIKSIKQLKGKSFVRDYPWVVSKNDDLPPKESYIVWIFVKKILLQHGITKPFKDFFKEFRLLPTSWESVAYSVLLKRFDAFIENMSMMQSLKNYDAGFSDLVPLSCLDVPAAGATEYRKDVNSDIIKLLRDTALHPPDTKVTKEVSKEFKGLKFFPVEDKDFDIFFKWLKEAEQKGWIKEFNDIMKQTMKEMEKKKNPSSPYILQGK